MIAGYYFQMLSEDRLNNSGSFFSQQTIFDLIYHLQLHRKEQYYVPIAFYAINALLHILLFLSAPTIAYLDFVKRLAITQLLIVFAVLYAVVFIQILIQLIKNKNLYLLEQIEALAFVVEPLLLLNTIALIYSNGLSPLTGLLICAAAQLLNSLFFQWFLFQNYRTYSLSGDGGYITSNNTLYQLLLIALSFVTLTRFQSLLGSLLLAIAVSTYLKHFTEIQMDCMEFRVLKAINLLHIVIALILVCSEITGIKLHGVSSVVALLVLLYLSISLTNKEKEEETRFTNVFQYEAGYEQMLKTIDYFTGLLKKTGHSARNDLYKFIFSAISEHNKECKKAVCDFATVTTLQELKDPNTKNLKQLTQKVLRKFEEHLQNYHKESADNKEITFNFLRFYAHVLNNRYKLQALLSEAAHLQLSWSEQCEFYQYRKICEAFQNSQAIDATKIDEDVIEFQNTMVSTLTSMQEFWSEFSEERVDLKKILLISAKITPYKAKLENIYKRKAKEEKFASFKIITLYALYQRVILNQIEEALKVEDLAKILGDRLRDKQEIKYLTKETEAGFIVISLSETKLGSIFLMTDLALSIYRCNRSQVLGKNVSNVMPVVFADKHDNILIDFLKKKRKTFNTDQRLLFGRDSNGYIFTIQLQLQKASISANDEFIFIGMVKHNKLRAAPLFAVVDNEGYIREYTASFQNIFFKNYKKGKLKSIQEIIPNYFDQNYEEGAAPDRTFVIDMINHKLGQITVTFDVKSVVVKGEHLGFLVRAVIKEEPVKQFVNNERLTQRLMRLRNDEELYSYDNSYNQQLNRFQIEKKHMQLMPKKQNSNFTLPFLNYQDLASFANREDESKEYGIDIKTVRYFNSHFERKDEEESFHSEVYSDAEKVDIKARIAEMRQKSQKKEDKAFVDSCFVAIVVVMLLALVILGFLYFIYDSEPEEESELLQSYSYEKKVRYQLPEYIIYSTMIGAGINSTYFNAKLGVVQSELIKSLSLSPLTQIQKESILKIIYVKSSEYIEGILESGLSHINELDQGVELKLYLLWAAILVLCLCLVLILSAMLNNFKTTQLGVYTVFLSLKEPLIRQIYEACKKLIIKVNLQTNKVQEDDDLLNLRKEPEEQNQIEKIKQFKVTSTPEDRTFWLQMVLPVVVLMAYALGSMFGTISEYKTFMNLKDSLDQYYEVVPLTSIELMKVIYKEANGHTLAVTNNLPPTLQKMEGNLRSFQKTTGNPIEQSMSVLYGDVCSNTAVVPANQRLSCQTLCNGIMFSGVSPALNYLKQQLLSTSLSSPQGRARLVQLIELHYMYIIPILVKLAESMQGTITSTLLAEAGIQTKVVILGMILFVLFGFYLVLFPLKRIEQEIKTTNAMIALMPPDPHEPVKKKTSNI